VIAIAQAAADAAANVNGAVCAQALPLARDLNKSEWLAVDELANMDARMSGA